ncbi:MAG: tRNA (adenosine(37)-N6)-dimethylallyltransferase MiaA [Chloroflexi bacterium]|nr:tRNA (adenosine(37)-N6)-dimethylallyltransferase MiaA [Chloroflexota bacterium]
MADRPQGKPLIAILGPTAMGKTALAIHLAREFEGEIVSADSRQIYRGMDIGTAKPSPEERRLVPHHLIDIVEPDQNFTLAQYQEAAYCAIEDILARDKVPFLVGGSGLYVKAVLEGFAIPAVAPRSELRTQLLAEAELSGPARLHARLAQVDPRAAAKIDMHNVRRVVRALEVYHATGRPISEWQERRPPSYRLLKIGLTMERRQLYQRIDERVERMLSQGLIDEVRRLFEQGYNWELPAMSGLGYKQLGAYLRGEVDLSTAVRSIKAETRRFVRQQYKWFRLDDPSIVWFDVAQDTYPAIRERVAEFLQRDRVRWET